MAFNWVVALPFIQMGLNELFGPKQDNYRPAPAMIPPDFAPMWAQTDWTNWQNSERNQMLMDFYGGNLTYAPQWDYTEPTFDPQTWGGAGTPMPSGPGGPWPNGNDRNDVPPPNADSETAPLLGPRQRFVNFTGEKPAAQYRSDQLSEVNRSGQNFSPELQKYFAERGIGGQDMRVGVTGAVQHQTKDYAQLKKEIEARAKQIKGETLTQLFGEVADAGPAIAQMAGAFGQSTNMWNQQAQQRYNNMMQQWEWNNANRQPTAGQQFGAAAGQALGYAMPYMFGGGGGGGSYYGSPMAYNPGLTPMGYLG